MKKEIKFGTFFLLTLLLILLAGGTFWYLNQEKFPLAQTKPSPDYQFSVHYDIPGFTTDDAAVSHYRDGHLEVRISFLTQTLNPGESKYFGNLSVTYTYDQRLVLTIKTEDGYVDVLDIDMSQVKSGSISLQKLSNEIVYASATILLKNGGAIVTSIWKGNEFLYIAQSFTNPNGSIREICVTKKDTKGKEDKACAGTDGSGDKDEVCKRLCDMLAAAKEHGDSKGAKELQKMSDALKCPRCKPEKKPAQQPPPK